MRIVESLFYEGGFIVYPLAICSFLSVFVFIERVWFFFQFRRQYRELFDKARDFLHQDKVEQAKGLGSLLDPLLQAPYNTLFEQTTDIEKWKAKRERVLVETHSRLGRSLWILGTVGSMAPFIGLFGTVVGIIKSFESIAQSGRSGFSVVAAGLSEALVATAVGIGVAVVAIIFYNYLQVFLKGLSLEFRHKMEDLSDRIPPFGS